MPRMRATRSAPAVLSLLAAIACGRVGAVYPPRPPATTGAPFADPAPSRITTHITLTREALQTALDAAVPKGGDGSFNAMHAERKYHWDRTGLDVSFGQGRTMIDSHVNARVELP